MDLKQYKVKIRNQLLNGVEEQAQKEKAIEQGEYASRCGTGVARGGVVRLGAHYKIPKEDYDELLRQMSIFRGPTISMPGHTTTGHDCGGSAGITYESDSDDSCDETDVGGCFVGKKVVRKTMKKVNAVAQEAQDGVVQGGKFHFVKSLKKFGKDAGDSMKKAGIQAVTKEIANQGVNFAKNNIGKLMSGAETVLPEALPVAEEVAPLALMAGSMKKPKRTRTVSQKEANRHNLIRKLMQQHGCSLAEASKYIKQENLQY